MGKGISACRSARPGKRERLRRVAQESRDGVCGVRVPLYVLKPGVVRVCLCGVDRGGVCDCEWFIHIILRERYLERHMSTADFLFHWRRCTLRASENEKVVSVRGMVRGDAEQPKKNRNLASRALL